MYELTGHRFGIAHSQKTLASFPTRINAAAVHLDRDKSLVHIHSPYNACSQGKHLAHFTSCLGHSATDSSASTQPFTPWLRGGRALPERGLCGRRRRHLVGLLAGQGWLAEAPHGWALLEGVQASSAGCSHW